MPRIDPIQLLNCLSILLSPNGGIKSTDEVHRLANLMTKFSKKLVSKCIYIQILKCTETELLGLFMASGGWRLVHMWLTESIVAKNWPLVKELLELLLLCPVDIERLKTNNCPKLVKELSKDDNHYAIRALASKLVELWLKTVKGEVVVPVSVTDIQQIVADAQLQDAMSIVKSETLSSPKKNEDENLCPNKSLKIEEIKPKEEKKEIVEMDSKIIDEIKEQSNQELPVQKISIQDGNKDKHQVADEVNEKEENSNRDKNKEKHRSKHKDGEKSSSSSNSKSSSSSKHSSKSHSSSSDKHKSSHKSSSSNRHSKDSKEKSKEKDRHSSSKSKSDSSSKKSSDKDKSSSSSKSREEKTTKSSDKSKEKLKDDKNKDSSSKKPEKTEEKPQSPPSIHKLGKIPKLSDVKKEKPSLSIEVRKPDEPKPKTVKTFHSKFRKHGLEEEVKPPPSRAAILNKKTTVVPPPIIPAPKRPSPAHNETPPEKKTKTIEPVEKPGSIKLIPPKPKPMMLLESDMFMDALNASATNKKEPKKRKRRTSVSKDAPSDSGSPPRTPAAVATSPVAESKSVPPRFYQDTLETDDNKSKTDANENLDSINEKDKDEEHMVTSEPHTLTINGLKGVLCYHKKKGPKKSIKWKPDIELEEVQYFELDETERVNVTKTFTDMKYLEKLHEREAFQKARNLSVDDVMEERTNWRPLLLIDTEGQIEVEHGKNSKEKDIQALRQKGTLQPLYFHKSMIPDSPHEPEPETHPYTEPTIIPLDDVTGNQDNVSDFRNVAWPEPKGNAPPPPTNINMPAIFPTNIAQFPAGFPAQFPGMPGFQAPPNMVPGDWQNGVPPMMPNGMPGPIPPTGIAPGAMPPGMMVPPENMMMNPEMFGAPNPMFPVGPDGFNMQPNMFPMDFNMPQGPTGPPGPPGPDGFGPGNFRGGMRGRSNWRGKGSGNWDGPPRGRGGRGGRKTVCMYFQRKGSCRQGDNCTFLHPGVNCPY